MNKESATAVPSAALLDDDPIQVIRNAVSRIRRACEGLHGEQPERGAEAMKFTISEELELVEQALQRVQPT